MKHITPDMQDQIREDAKSDAILITAVFSLPDGRLFMASEYHNKRGDLGAVIKRFVEQGSISVSVSYGDPQSMREALGAHYELVEPVEDRYVN